MPHNQNYEDIDLDLGELFAQCGTKDCHHADYRNMRLHGRILCIERQKFLQPALYFR